MDKGFSAIMVYVYGGSSVIFNSTHPRMIIEKKKKKEEMPVADAEAAGDANYSTTLFSPVHLIYRILPPS